ncbi:MAG: nucleotide exchange factor GrpE, partial [Lachnospiraceae bacterium]|nr:nucleotide exchange factor GrpE [Lachnospiraceae bacterium]
DGAGEESEEKKEDPRDKKIAELNDKVVRQMAEFDNFRKRTEKEKSETFANGEKAVIEAILPVIDNFERALDMAGQDEEKKDDPFIEGMDKVYRQLMDELDKLGVKPIEALGTDFDPNLHNAVMQEETEEYESGKVCKELQKGYLLKDSVVRHSMVSVAK